MTAVPPPVHAATLSSGQACAGDLCLPAPSVSPETDNETVLQLFAQHKELVSLPVVENGRPFGLINRHIFLSQIVRPFYRELYDKKSCIAFMDKSPLIVDAATRIDQMAGLAVAYGDKSLADGFIVTSKDSYLGVGLGIDLMRAVSEMHARQHRQIMQSIEYASVIQGSMLATSRQAMGSALADWCLAWEPRDHVGGDCYFMAYERGWLAVIADCTGHGVPGAFMTLIFSSALDRALALHGPARPGLLLQEINGRIKDALGQVDGRGEVGRQASNDGCDAILVAMDTTEGRLRWSSARMPAFLVSGQTGDIAGLAADRMGVGYTQTPRDYAWPSHERPMAPGDVFFTTTDGLVDQVGGERRIMFGKRRLQEVLARCRALPMAALGEELLREHARYQGEQARRDDLTFWGWRA